MEMKKVIINWNSILDGRENYKFFIKLNCKLFQLEDFLSISNIQIDSENALILCWKLIYDTIKVPLKKKGIWND